MNRERCNGSYENVNGEFGKVIRRECIGCQRRTAKGEPIKVQLDIKDASLQNWKTAPKPELHFYMTPPEFEVGCPKKVSEE